MRKLGPDASCSRDGSCRAHRSGPPAAHGFSLTELIVTMALLIVMVALLWSSLSPRNPRQERTVCGRNLEKLFVALQIYANDSGGKFPARTGVRTSEEALDALVPRYTVDTGAFICPGSKDAPLPSGESLRKQRISYAYYMGRGLGSFQECLMSDRQVDTNAKARGEYAFSATGKPPGNNHRESGGNLLFCDGHVESSPARLSISLQKTEGVVLLNPRP